MHIFLVVPLVKYRPFFRSKPSNLLEVTGAKTFVSALCGYGRLAGEGRDRFLVDEKCGSSPGLFERMGNVDFLYERNPLFSMKG